jgi:HEAT repeat protein
MATAERRDEDRPGVSERRFAAARAGHRGDEAGARTGLADDEPAVRAAAIGALVRMDRATPADIAVAIADTHPSVRRVLCELAPRLRTLDVSSLLSDPDPNVVEAAAFACGETNTVSAVPLLATIAREHTDPLCRESAVAALGAIGEEEGRVAVLGALEDIAPIRRRAVIALAAFSGADVDLALRARLTDRDWQVRQAAEDVLGT